MHTTYLKQIGVSFRQLRVARNIKREFIAGKCAVSTGAIAKLEQGKGDVGLGKLILYLHAMDATLIELAEMLPPPAKIMAKPISLKVVPG